MFVTNYRLNMIENRIDDTIKMLQIALEKCNAVNFSNDAEYNVTPSYVLGWNKSTLQNALFDLKRTRNLITEAI